MHFARENCRHDQLVRAYGDGVVTIGEQTYQHSLIIARDTLINDWRPQAINELAIDDFQPVLDLQPEIFLLGTGSVLHFPSPALTGRLLEAGIGIEIMDTAAACRTFNILLSEERHVAAGLMLL